MQAGVDNNRGMAAVAIPAPQTSPLPEHHSWIGSRTVAGRAGSRPAIDPATGVAFAQVSLFDAGQAGEALAAARASFSAWSALTIHERLRYLGRLRAEVLRDADRLAALIAQEQGKPVAEAHLVEIFPALEALKHLEHHAPDLLRDEEVESDVLLLAHKQGRVVLEPYGVLLVITPWNYPFGISMTGVAAALAAGNSVVLKPAPSTTLVGLAIGELARRAGLPDGVLSVVACDDGVAQSLVEDARVAKILFTGSVPTGKRIMASAARNLTPVVLELGGKDAAIVLRDADLERTAAGLVWGAFLNAGQTCASVERVYVEEPVARELIDRVVAETKALRMGDPRAADTDVGPLALERQRQIVDDHVKDALARGAQALTGGVRPEGPGYFYPPTVLVNVDHTMKVMREETFGPLLPIMVVKDQAEALRFANDSEYGLTASVWTRDPEKARALETELQAGVVTTNDCVYSYGEPAAPWGGYKHSGVGRTHGAAGLREMVQVKYLASEMGGGRALWWFPYGAEFLRFMSTANRALHGGILARLRNLLRLGGFSRYWRRARHADLLRNVGKLFS